MQKMKYAPYAEHRGLSTRTWVIILAAVFLIFAAAEIILICMPAAGTVARVYVDDALVWEIDLAAVTEPVEHTVTTEYGTNTLRAEHGRICMLSADCADETCVHMGWISGSGTPIVCLPHRLVVQIEGAEAETDGVDVIAG